MVGATVAAVFWMQWRANCDVKRLLLETQSRLTEEQTATAKRTQTLVAEITDVWSKETRAKEEMLRKLQQLAVEQQRSVDRLKKTFQQCFPERAIPDSPVAASVIEEEMNGGKSS